MRILALKCDQCGAPLDVSANREQFVCDYCGSGLHASRLQPASQEQASPAASASLTQRDQEIIAELKALDSEWEAYRAKYLPKDGGGEYFVPDPEVYRLGAWVAGVLAAGFGVTALFNGSVGLSAIPVILGICSIAHLLHQAKVGEVYARSIRNYRDERLAIVRRMSDAAEV